MSLRATRAPQSIPALPRSTSGQWRYSVGLQREVEEAAAREFRQGGAIVAVESLGGKELAYFYRSYNEGWKA